MSIARRTYGQFCGLARTLDLVGDRWTLLVVRELGTGPKRYTDLVDALPGIGTSLLADRLQTLQGDGLIERRELPRPAAVTVYELTDAGMELMDAVKPLAMWGVRHVMDSPKRRESFRTEWALLFIEGFIDPAAAAGVRGTYEFRLGRSVAHLVVDRGDVAIRSGPADSPDVVLTSDVGTLTRLTLGRIDPAKAFEDGDLEIEGDPAAVRDFTRLTQTVIDRVNPKS